MKFLKTWLLIVCLVAVTLVLLLLYQGLWRPRHLTEKWLEESWPYGYSSLMPPIPYESYEEWREAGLKIHGIENHLIHFYNSAETPEYKFRVMNGMSAIGTPVMVDKLTTIVTSEKDSTVVVNAIECLAALACEGNQYAQDSLLQLIEQGKIDSEENIRRGLLELILCKHKKTELFIEKNPKYKKYKDMVISEIKPLIKNRQPSSSE